jgi:hypothetical protein
VTRANHGQALIIFVILFYLFMSMTDHVIHRWCPVNCQLSPGFFRFYNYTCNVRYYCNSSARTFILWMFPLQILSLIHFLSFMDVNYHFSSSRVQVECVRVCFVFVAFSGNILSGLFIITGFKHWRIANDKVGPEPPDPHYRLALLRLPSSPFVKTGFLRKAQ